MSAAERKRKSRAGRNEEIKEKEKERDRQRKAVNRASETYSQRINRTLADRQRQELNRALETSSQRSNRQMEDRQRQNINRARRTRMRAEERIATKTYEILNGDIEIPSLTNDIDSIGDMTFICHHCGAYKFQKETSSNCCLSGQIDLPKFPCPPQNLHDLWFGDSEEAKIFRKYSRILNNAVCLSSVLVGSKPVTSFAPSIIYQGKVTQLLGSL